MDAPAYRTESRSTLILAVGASVVLHGLILMIRHVAPQREPAAEMIAVEIVLSPETAKPAPLLIPAPGSLTVPETPDEMILEPERYQVAELPSDVRVQEPLELGQSEPDWDALDRPIQEMLQSERQATRPTNKTPAVPQPVKKIEQEREVKDTTEPTDAPVQESASQPADAALSTAKRTSYQAQIRAMITRHRRYPYLARQRRQTGEVTVRFTIGRDGRLLPLSGGCKVRVEKNSGSGLLDRASISAVVDAALQFPPLPDELPEDRLEMSFTFHYTLR